MSCPAARPLDDARGTKKAPNIGDHVLFSIMTTEPNGIVEPIHDKAMPVMLMTANDIEQWLEGSVAEALALRRPAADDAIVVAPLDKAAS